MAAQKFLTLVGTQTTLVSSTQVSAGATEGGKVVGLADNGFLDPSVLPPGIGVDAQSFTTSEAIAANALVNINGTQVRNADASTARVAHGYVKSAIASGASGTVYFSGAITGLSSKTPGSKQFLGAAGALTESPNTATAGFIIQNVGSANDATSVEFRRDGTLIVVQ